MKDHMGSQHHSKPVTDSDKKMSERHLAHRAEVDDMKKDGESKEKILKKSIKYNEKHAKEHVKANKDAKKELKKLAKRRGSSDGFIVS
jgi:hypothetical protein